MKKISESQKFYKDLLRIVFEGVYISLTLDEFTDKLFDFKDPSYKEKRLKDGLDLFLVRNEFTNEMEFDFYIKRQNATTCVEIRPLDNASDFINFGNKKIKNFSLTFVDNKFYKSFVKFYENDTVFAVSDEEKAYVKELSYFFNFYGDLIYKKTSFKFNFYGDLIYKKTSFKYIEINYSEYEIKDFFIADNENNFFFILDKNTGLVSYIDLTKKNNQLVIAEDTGAKVFDKKIIDLKKEDFGKFEVFLNSIKTGVISGVFSYLADILKFINKEDNRFSYIEYEFRRSPILKFLRKIYSEIEIKEEFIEDILEIEGTSLEDYCYLRDNEPEVFKIINWDRKLIGYCFETKYKYIIEMTKNSIKIESGSIKKELKEKSFYEGSLNFKS